MIQKDLFQKYKFQEVEKKWQQSWEQNKLYVCEDISDRDKIFVIDTPPPTVSGTLHIGHLYSYTHTDYIARYRRMRGQHVYYPIGFDDNGLPTERLVEKKKKIMASKMPRAEFVEICQAVALEEEEKFRTLFKNIGLSVDWNLEYQTINPNSQKISQLSFLDLAAKKQVYRGEDPILWDTIDQTALAQAEIEDKERKSFMNDLMFKTNEGEQITIATTRPELLPACVAVFYHPEDERYRHLDGKYAITPIFNAEVPIIADDMVKPEKGTGLVMCCTFGDQTDVIWWRKHKLPSKIIINKFGKMENLPSEESAARELEGLKVIEARAKIIEILEQQKFLVAKHEITQSVKCAERSGAPLEILMIPQWFIKTTDHKAALMQKAQEIKWRPNSMKIKLEAWIESLNWDWCISRQRYFGVPFPVWYSKRPGEEGKVLFAKPHQLPVDPNVDLPEGYSADEVIADKDVMDTWSTSSITPQMNSQGISEEFMVDKDRHIKLFPADLRPQSHEIIRSWAFYTILKAYLHQNSLPWYNIMISGWCLAQDKSKMSKSKGNVVSAESLLADFGADVARYWSASAKLGVDTVYSEDVLKNGRRLVNKLWNAAKFIMQHVSDLDNDLKSAHIDDISNKITNDFDQYILNELAKMIAKAEQALDEFEYSVALDVIERFFWQDFCDNYLEITKMRAYGQDANSTTEGILSARITLNYVLVTLLKLFAPFIPFITEEIYLKLGIFTDSIHARGQWPKPIKAFTRINAENSIALLNILELTRKVKAGDNFSIKMPIAKIEVIGGNINSADVLQDLKNVINAEEVIFVQEFLEEKSRAKNEFAEINVFYGQEVN